MRALPCLSLFLSLGVIMCSRNDPDAAGKPRSAQVPASKTVPEAGSAAAPADAPEARLPRTLTFAIGGDSVYLLKVADWKHFPEGSFLGEEAFREARRGAPGRILVYVVVPNSLGQVAFRHTAGGKTYPMADTRYIFRNPASPRHTFAIVDAADPGRIEGTIRNGASGAIDLGPLAGALRAMPFHWDRPDSGSITYRGLPASLSGRMPR